MTFAHPRLRREAKTIQYMIEIYCQKQHGERVDLCDECADLQDYALSRLERCPFQENKSTCANCKVHCYRPEMRERIRKVMRFSGPRMMLHHPILTILHLWVDGRREAPELRKKQIINE
jgi:hypothetical protein